MFYRRLHALTQPGLHFQDLVVKVLEAPQSSPSSDAFLHVLVGDESAVAILVCRAVRKPDIKPGRFLLINGTINCFQGILTLHCGPRTQDLQPLHKHGGGSFAVPSTARANNLSAVMHHVGVVLVRAVANPKNKGGGKDDDGDEAPPPFVVEYGLQVHEDSVWYVASTLPRSHEPFLEGAGRALEEATLTLDDEEEEEEQQGLEFHLAAHLPHLTEWHNPGDGKVHAYHFFIATTTTTTNSTNDNHHHIIWKTRAQVKACRHSEKGRHAYPIVNQIRNLLETALRTGGGILTGPGWDELHQYLTMGDDEENKDNEEGNHHHKHHHHHHGNADHSTKVVSSLLRQASLLKRPTQLPVTLLSGFLGAGKTTLLKHILQNQQDWRVAVLVNDMNELNIDAALVAQDRRRQVVHHTNQEERIVSLANGCICCTLREDLLAQIVSLASEQEFDYLLIESSGISEPLAVAETFAFEDDQGRSLSSLARLDTTVTVVDAADLHRHLQAFDKIATTASSESKKRQEKTASSSSKEECPLIMCEEEEEKTLADLMVEQIEFADVVILNKMDLLLSNNSSQKPSSPLMSLPTLEALVHKLNPGAKVLVAEHARVDLCEILNTGLFSLDKAQQAPGWLQELRNPNTQAMTSSSSKSAHVPETIEYDVSSFCYRRARPFHPARLHALVYGAAGNGGGGGGGGGGGNAAKEEKGKGALPSSNHSPLACLVRVKGYLWLSAHMQHMVFWSLAGSVHSFSMRDDDRWLAATDPVEWPDTLTTTQLQEKWTPVWGDRRQEIVLIGVHMKQAEVEAALDACLLTEEEMEKGLWKEEEPRGAMDWLFLPPLPKRKGDDFGGGDGEEESDEEDDSESEEEEEEESN